MLDGIDAGSFGRARAKNDDYSRSRSFGDFADNAAWVACGEHALRNVPRDHAPGPDHRAMPDMHAGQNDRSAAHPDVRSNLDRLAELLSPSLLGIQRMHGRVYLHRRAKQGE